MMHCWVSALRPEGSTSCRPRGGSVSLCLRTLPLRAAPAGLCTPVLSAASKSTPLQNGDNVALLEWEKTSDLVLGTLP